MSDADTTVLAHVEKPLDRLNYFNGQRLEARDLKLEQQYHIRVRRWLNKSLYTTGIARGLEVVAQDPGKSDKVIVSPGLALDSEGREIILLDQVSVAAVGTPSTQPGVVKGNYLTIQYNEQTTEEQQDGCNVQARKKKGSGCGNGGGGSKLAWGGPALVRAQPVLGFTDYLPSDTSGKIVLAQIELDSTCNVVSVHPEVRRYVGAASAAKVFQYALEGEREVTSGDGVNLATENFTTIYFHIRGREPNAVTLFLRADTFSTLHYTEMGEHAHGLSVAGTIGNANPVLDVTHSHTLGQAKIGNESDHVHKELFCIFRNAKTDEPGKHMQLDNFGAHGKGNVLNNIHDVSDPPAVVGGATPHTHSLTGSTDPFEIKYDHTHSFNFTPGSSFVSPAGVTDPAYPPGGAYSTRRGAPLTYVNQLQILIDDVDQTSNILTQLTDSDQFGYKWSQKGNELGNGTANHPLVQRGTGPIKLDFLPSLKFIEGEHQIEIRSTPLKDSSGQPVPTGGRILYNLYVE